MNWRRLKRQIAAAILGAVGGYSICAAIATSTVPATNNLNVHTYIGLGTPGRDTKLLDYDDSSTVGLGTTANATFRTEIKLAPNATDTSINLSTYFDTVSYVGATDVSGATSGFLIGPATGAGNKFTVGTSGVYEFKNGAATPPTLYFSNPSGTDTVYVEVVAAGTHT